MTQQFVAIGYRGDARVSLHLLLSADEASTWFVEVEDYHRGLDRESMWLRARVEGGNVAEDVRDWSEFMDDWRRAHPAGVVGSFCESFEVEPLFVECRKAA